MIAFLNLYGCYNVQHLITLHYCKHKAGTSKYKLITKDRNTLIEQSDTLIEQSPR